MTENVGYILGEDIEKQIDEKVGEKPKENVVFFYIKKTKPLMNLHHMRATRQSIL